MAKASTKTTSKEPKAKSKAPAKASAGAASIEKASTDALDKLRSLAIEQELQNDIEWCLGSYRADGNPVGLIGTLQRAVQVFKNEQAKKTKGVTAKFIADIQKAVDSKG